MNKQQFTIIVPLFAGLLLFSLLWHSSNLVQAAQVDDQLVIKEANLSLTVMDTTTAVQTALNLAESSSGYVLNQRLWQTDEGGTFGEIRFGVPAERFESLLNNLRTLGTVENEQLSGQDVSDTAVDLQSRLDNLTSNQIRMRSFLNQTRNITETLAVHQRLVQVENEINSLQGQLNYQTGRASAATITLNLVELLPTPTPTPLPTPQSWSPSNTAKVASVRAQENAQDVADFTIYQTIAKGPWLLLLSIVGWVGLRTRRRRQAQATPQSNPNNE